MNSRFFVSILALSFGAISQTALSAELKSIRAGEDERLTRLVLLSDTPEVWNVQLNQQRLTLKSNKLTTRLDKTIELPMASGLDRVRVSKTKQMANQTNLFGFIINGKLNISI